MYQPAKSAKYELLFTPNDIANIDAVVARSGLPRREDGIRYAVDMAFRLAQIPERLVLRSDKWREQETLFLGPGGDNTPLVAAADTTRTKISLFLSEPEIEQIKWLQIHWMLDYVMQVCRRSLMLLRHILDSAQDDFRLMYQTNTGSFIEFKLPVFTEKTAAGI